MESEINTHQGNNPKVNEDASTEKKYWKLTEKDCASGKILILDFDTPGERVNVLNLASMDELDKLIDQISLKSPKALLIRSLKKDQFIAGADINVIKSLNTREDASEKAAEGQRVFNKLETLKCLKVVAVNGPTMGGGFELSLACDAIILADSTKVKLALPEVKLGVLPGFGGTQRLPRRIGLTRAIDLILTGKNLIPKKAKQLGVADDILPVDGFLENTVTWVEGKLKSGFKRKRKLTLAEWVLGETSIGRNILFSQARKKVIAATKGKYPAVLKILHVLSKTTGNIRCTDKGYKIEAEAFGDLAVTEVSKNLIHIFFLMERSKKLTGSSDPEVKAQEIYSTGVVGAGVMGGGIAWLFSQNGFLVAMKDLNEAALKLGHDSAMKMYSSILKRRRMKKSEVDLAMSRITPTMSYEHFNGADLAVEAVIEKMEIKQAVIADLEKVMPEKAVIASNTSSLSLTAMASKASHPERVLGMHFFNPVNKMPLVEIIKGEKTNDQSVTTVVALSKKCGKTPIVVKDGPGFLVNRVLGPFLNEAGFLLEEGVPIHLTDKALLDFGMPMGPFRLLDEVGLDVASKVAKILHEGLGDRLEPSSAVDVLVKNGRLGKKSKKGFYLYSGDSSDRKPPLDETVYKELGITLKAESDCPDKGTIADRLIYLMINEAALCLSEGIAENPLDVDVGTVFGLGFPPFRGGLLKYANDISAKKVLQGLEEFSKKYGNRFEPAPYLRELADQGKNF